MEIIFKESMTLKDLESFIENTINTSNVDLLKKLLKSYPIETKNYLIENSRLAPLCKAAINGNLEMVKYLLLSNDIKDIIDINEKNRSEFTPLLCACKEGHFEIIKFLLSSKDLNKKANIHVTRTDGSNALFYAANSGNVEIVDYLITISDLPENLNINTKNFFKYDALMVSCTWGHLDVVKYLLESPKLKEHASILEVCRNGKNSFLYACMRGKLEIVKYFMDNDKLCPNPYLGGNNKEAALVLAYKYNHKDIVEYLLSEKKISIDSYTWKWIQSNDRFKDEVGFTVILNKDIKTMIETYHHSKILADKLEKELEYKEVFKNKMKV